MSHCSEQRVHPDTAPMPNDMSTTSPRPSPPFANGGEGEDLLRERFAADALALALAHAQEQSRFSLNVPRKI